MRDYGKVHALTFWVELAAKLLPFGRHGRHALLLAFYLETGPSSTMTGLYYAPLAAMSAETGLSLKETRAALKLLNQAGHAFFDDGSATVWVPEMASRQIAKALKPGDKQIPGIVKLLERMRWSPFMGAFFERCHEAFNLPEDGPWKPLPGEAPPVSPLSVPLPKPLGKPLAQVRRTGKQGTVSSQRDSLADDGQWPHRNDGVSRREAAICPAEKDECPVYTYTPADLERDDERPPDDAGTSATRKEQGISTAHAVSPPRRSSEGPPSSSARRRIRRRSRRSPSPILA